jgi:aldehyde:ferredoxin oxidoreductase
VKSDSSRPFGYAGQILKVNLSSREVKVTPTSHYTDFLGGRGLAARIYWDDVPPDTGAFDPANALIFASGPLCGVPVIGASRWTACGKSPMTVPEHFCYSSLGGRWGAELKFAGYDAVVIQGQSQKPVFLFIDDESVEIRDASDLRNRGAIETREHLKDKLGSSARVLAIGPAGERMVPIANLLAENDASGSAGLGAVMGSKRLKAIATRGSRKGVRIRHPDRFRDLAEYFRSLEKGVFTAWGTDYQISGPAVKKDPCYGCQGNCLRIVYRSEDGQKGKFMCQSALFYQPWAYKYYGERNDVPFYANKLCDQYGLDTWAIDVLIAWLNRCRRSGILNDDSSSLPLSKIGSLEFIETLVTRITTRDGLGEILGLGSERAAALIGAEAVSQVKHSDPYDPRLYITTALLWATEPREPIQELHEVGLPAAQWVSWAKGIPEAYVSTEVLRGIARKFWGGEAAADFSTIEGKAQAATLIQGREYAKECLILCDWLWPVTDIKHSADHVGDPSLESRLLSAVTGSEVDEQGLYRIGERVLNQQRAIMIREGHAGRQDDRLPDEWHTQPLKSNYANTDCIVPGPGGQVISRKGAVVRCDDFEKMKDEYYRLRGWDPASGLQTGTTLRSLGLADVADDLERRGLLG